MLKNNIEIILFGVSLYIVVMSLTTFWIIPTLKLWLQLNGIWIIVISLGAAAAYIVFIIKLMQYLESKNKTVW